jgi:hypothetical protein
MTRTDWLKALVSLERPLDDILSALNAHGWDSDVALVTVCRQHLLRVLDKYLNGHLMEEDSYAAAMRRECEEVGESSLYQRMIRGFISANTNDSLYSP